VLFAPRNGRRPAYTPINSAKQLMAGQRALASSKSIVYTGQGYGSWGGYGWTGYGWGGFGWNPLFIGNGYFCDPFSLMMLYGDPACFIPGAYMYGYNPMFGYDPFLANFWFGPFSSTSLLFGPSFLGPNCLLCSPYGYDPFTFGMYNSLAPDPYMPTLGSSVSISNGDLPGLVPTTSVPEPAPATSGGASAYTYASPSATNQPVTLVLTDGTKIQATQYELTANGMFHYVTTGGQAEKIPFTQVDIKATMSANSDKGVNFLVPQSPQTAPQTQARQR
jgi:hypothetical protein